MCVTQSSTKHCVHSHINGIEFGTSLYFFQSYLFCTAANNESNCCADSVPRTIPQPAHVHRKNQSLWKSILIWARTSREKQVVNLLMQALISLLLLPSFNIYIGLFIWSNGLPVFGIRLNRALSPGYFIKENGSFI